MDLNSKIYLDYQSTTPVDERVIDKMTPFLNSYFANPHSTEHEMGRYVSRSVEDARMKVAKLINSDSREIIFTSGATESNNLAIKGSFLYRYRGRGASTGAKRAPRIANLK